MAGVIVGALFVPKMVRGLLLEPKKIDGRNGWQDFYGILEGGAL